MIDESEQSLIQYTKYKFPMAVTKESLFKMTFTNMGSGVYVEIKSVEHPDFPESAGVIRLF